MVSDNSTFILYCPRYPWAKSGTSASIIILLPYSPDRVIRSLGGIIEIKQITVLMDY